MLKLKLQYFDHLMQRTDSLEKTLMLGKIEGRKRRGWQLNGHEFEQALDDGEGQGRLVCCCPWGCNKLDITERLNNNNNKTILSFDIDRCMQNIITINFSSSMPEYFLISGVSKEQPNLSNMVVDREKEINKNGISLLRVPTRTTVDSNHSILKEINPECSSKELLLKLRLQDFGHVMQRVTHWKRY